MKEKVKELREYIAKMRAQINQTSGDELHKRAEAVISAYEAEIKRLKTKK